MKFTNKYLNFKSLLLQVVKTYERLLINFIILIIHKKLFLQGLFNNPKSNLDIFLSLK